MLAVKKFNNNLESISEVSPYVICFSVVLIKSMHLLKFIICASVLILAIQMLLELILTVIELHDLKHN
jgi:hypothetical protein